MKPNDYSSTLEKNLANVLKSTKDERKVLIEMLACIEVLKPHSFDRAIKGKHDWTFVQYWRGEDGYNQEALDSYFKAYMT